MKTKEEINFMVAEMVKALCGGGFGRLEAMLGAKASQTIPSNFRLKCFAKPIFSKLNLMKVWICIIVTSLSAAITQRMIL